MRRFWLFRSNLKTLEYYHDPFYHDLKNFKEGCHDFYMLLPLWLLENDYFNEVTIWRLSSIPLNDIVFDVNGKKYIQRWVTNFIQCIDYESPDISFFRGGFKEYDNVTRERPGYFGLKLYLGAGRRITSQWGGVYDYYLMEDERDFLPISKYNNIPFYKTASPSIFHQINNEMFYKEWDICWPCNFEQIRYKGQELFLNTIADSVGLRDLKIVHCGNREDVAKKMCEVKKIKNIHFTGKVTRTELNMFLNRSKFGLNLSNLQDGCPRVSTEILMSGTPLIINEETRLLKYYKQKGVVEVNQKNIEEKIKLALFNYDTLKKEVEVAIQNELSFENTCKKNIELWEKIGVAR
jgi:hypothetical protein